MSKLFSKNHQQTTVEETPKKKHSTKKHSHYFTPLGFLLG